MMRDLSQWKDKVELSLDGRQLFFVFFGGAVMACLLFTGGVMTGRRLEARAIALETPGADDPLAMLDQLGDLEDEELTYHQALTKDTRTPAKPKDAVAVDPESHAKPAVAKPAVPAAPVIAPKPALPTLKPITPAKPAHAANTDEDVSEAPVVIATKPEAKPVVRAELKPEARSDAQEAPEKVAKESLKPAVGAVHFTLQLSAFAAKREADDFMRRVLAAGYRPFVVSSDVPGKGIMYRVRIGDFLTKDVALSEKNNVEKKLKVVAYLARL